MSAVGGPTIQAIQQQITIPPGTQQNAPQTTNIDLGGVWCYSVEVEVPSGPHGVMGFRIQYAGTQVVPWGVGGGWLVVDDYEKTYPWGAEVGSSLQVVGYNLGNFAHSVFLRFLATPIASYQSALVQAPQQALDLSGLGQG